MPDVAVVKAIFQAIDKGTVYKYSLSDTCIWFTKL